MFLVGYQLPVSRGPRETARPLGLVEWSVPVGVGFVGPAVCGTCVRGGGEAGVGAVPPNVRRRCYRVLVRRGDRRRCVPRVLIRR